MARLKAVAYHEAGHAVAAWRFGHPIESVSIVAGESFLGKQLSESPLTHMELGDDPAPEVIQAIEQEIIVLWAGEAAQKRFNPRTWRHGHGSEDRYWIDWLISKTFFEETKEERQDKKRRMDEEEQRWKQGLPRSPSLWTPKELETREIKRREQEQAKLIELYKKAAALINECWDEVEAVAQALLEHKQLSGEEATRLLEEVTGEVIPRSSLFDYANDINKPPDGW